MIPLTVAVTVDGEQVTVDWTGSSPQVDGGINSPMPFTRSCAYTAIRSIMDQEVPNCHGYTRAITVTAPRGSIANPELPGACGARGVTGYRMIDCLFGALAQAVPHKVCADGSGGSTLPTISGWRDGRPIVFCEVVMGSWGATATHDGQDGISHLGANITNVPVEMAESTQPLRFEQYGLVPDTGGAGKFRGGLSVVREYRLLAEEATLNVRSDKRRHRSYGLFGGGQGASSWNTINPDRENRTLPVLLMQPVELKRGDVFRHVTAGGGGYGDPLERDPQHVLRDVIEEKSDDFTRRAKLRRRHPARRPTHDRRGSNQRVSKPGQERDGESFRDPRIGPHGRDRWRDCGGLLREVLAAGRTAGDHHRFERAGRRVQQR